MQWSSRSYHSLEAGCYVLLDGERYSLLEPYAPEARNEVEQVFSPSFYSFADRLSKVPATITLFDGTVTFDWTINGTAMTIVEAVVAMISEASGQTWQYHPDDLLALSGMRQIASSSASIRDILEAIAQEWQTEWWLETKNTEPAGTVERLVRFGRCEKSIKPVVLEVGTHIGVPSVSSNSEEGYYTRFYSFGSTRNMIQTHQDFGTALASNKRLALAGQPYVDRFEGLSAEQVFSRVLYFDDIYPRMTKTIEEVVIVHEYLLDDNGRRIVDRMENGYPLYKTFPVFFVRFSNLAFVNQVHSHENPDGMLVAGLPVSLHFDSGVLMGQEFELEYFEQESYRTSIHSELDEQGIQGAFTVTIPAGSFRIVYRQEDQLILPSDYLAPVAGDRASLFNLYLDDAAIQTAQAELLQATQDYIASLSDDANTYDVQSYASDFQEALLEVGTPVRLVFNASQEILTRVVAVEQNLVFPRQQSLRLGQLRPLSRREQLAKTVDETRTQVDLLSSQLQGAGELRWSVNNLNNQLYSMWQRQSSSLIHSPNSASVQGGLTILADGNLSSVPPTNWYETLNIDQRTLRWKDGLLTVIGTEGEGGSVSEQDIALIHRHYSHVVIDPTGREDWSFEALMGSLPRIVRKAGLTVSLPKAPRYGQFLLSAPTPEQVGDGVLVTLYFSGELISTTKNLSFAAHTSQKENARLIETLFEADSRFAASLRGDSIVAVDLLLEGSLDKTRWTVLADPDNVVAIDTLTLPSQILFDDYLFVGTPQQALNDQLWSQQKMWKKQEAESAGALVWMR